MPRVSIVLPIYESQATLDRCLARLVSQSYRDREILAVDSSPGPDCERIVHAHIPEVRLIRSATRLTPHQALNLGAEAARGELLAFIDPDAYPRADWVALLVEAYEAWGGVVAGGVACYGGRWLDLGAHLCKFDKWLPFSRPRPVQEVPTVNMLMPRTLFDRCGAFLAVPFHADTLLSWRMQEAGIPLRLQPSAIVEHHHQHSWGTLLAERGSRGRGYAEACIAREAPSRSKLLWLAALSFFPLRLSSQLLRVGRNATAAHMARAFMLSLPVVISGLYAWLLGECAVFAGRLLGRRAAAR